MKLADFDYPLPPELVAQTPAPQRDASRMMVVDRARGAILHGRRFRHFPEFLRDGDVVVVNDSRVIPARLTGRKDTGARIEILLLRRIGREDPAREDWEVLLKPAKRVTPGLFLALGPDAGLVVEERLTDKKWRIRLSATPDVDSFVQKHGRPPLPPYIRRRPEDPATVADRERYQTVYARVAGSVAAPTAGLHFTPEVLGDLRDRGIPVATVTLHVGHGTFLPIETGTVEDHRMEAEWYAVDEETARTVNEAKRVVAVGTTATRVLETASDGRGRLSPAAGWTSLYLYPGCPFHRVEALLTNFHLPRSSLFLLVCAFAGRDLMQEAYAQAVAERYRFYSYGDCMLIL